MSLTIWTLLLGALVLTVGTSSEKMEESEAKVKRKTRCKINKDLIPIKAHYFFFMAAMGPILPFLNVFGKQLGVSEVVMGSITGILPFMFLIAKPIFGFIVDYFREQRKIVFMALITVMSLFYMFMYFIPQPEDIPHNSDMPYEFQNLSCQQLKTCSKSELIDAELCNDKGIHSIFCDWECDNGNNGSELLSLAIRDNTSEYQHCLKWNTTDQICSSYHDCCNFTCFLDKSDIGKDCLYGTITFWAFVLLMSCGTIGFNVANSVSDAVCFDVLGSGGEMGYGKQRVFGTIGFGIAALLAGYGIDWWSAGSVTKNYTPSFVLLLIFIVVDLFCCTKLQLPPIPRSQSILKDIANLVKHRHIVIFLVFATFAGINDSFMIYYLFWYLEDLAQVTNSMENIKLLEGLVVAAETLGGEVIFFSLSGKILKKVGYGYSLTMCFFFYAIRLGLIAVIPSPWWAVAVEFFMQGPTYAMCYTTIVAYASAVSPPGASATMQGLVAGMDDGFGYAIGSMIGGILYSWVGGRVAFASCAVLALLCSIVHCILYECFLKHHMVKAGSSGQAVYRSPDDALSVTDTPTKNSTTT